MTHACVGLEVLIGGLKYNLFSQVKHLNISKWKFNLLCIYFPGVMYRIKSS